jgi:hypothetical protein
MHEQPGDFGGLAREKAFLALTLTCVCLIASIFDTAPDITSQEDLREAARSLTRHLESKNNPSATKVTVAQTSIENAVL